jgi:uncharacterized membrane protein
MSSEEKKMALRRTDMVSLGVIGLSVVLTAAVYERLPALVATHFDLAGNPNGWMSRGMAASFAPALALGLWAFLRFLPRILPATERKRLGDSSAPLVAALTSVFVVAAHLLILYRAIVPGASIVRVIWVVLGAFYVAMGLVLPRIKRNAFMGIRTPWTLTSDENWARTQRVGGYAMVAAGVLSALLGGLGGTTGGVVALAVLLLGAFVPVAYSLVLARRHDQGS